MFWAHTCADPERFAVELVGYPASALNRIDSCRIISPANFGRSRKPHLIHKRHHSLPSRSRIQQTPAQEAPCGGRNTSCLQPTRNEPARRASRFQAGRQRTLAVSQGGDVLRGFSLLLAGERGATASKT